MKTQISTFARLSVLAVCLATTVACDQIFDNISVSYNGTPPPALEGVYWDQNDLLKDNLRGPVKSVMNLTDSLTLTTQYNQQGLIIYNDYVSRYREEGDPLLTHCWCTYSAQGEVTKVRLSDGSVYSFEYGNGDYYVPFDLDNLFDSGLLKGLKRFTNISQDYAYGYEFHFQGGQLQVYDMDVTTLERKSQEPLMVLDYVGNFPVGTPQGTFSPALANTYHDQTGFPSTCTTLYTTPDEQFLSSEILSYELIGSVGYKSKVHSLWKNIQGQGNSMIIEEWEYDSFGNPSVYTYQGATEAANPKLLREDSYTYTRFDSHHNWVERQITTRKADDSLTKTTERRVITYFE